MEVNNAALYRENQWSKFLQTLLSQLNSSYGQQRLNSFNRLQYFFEGWFEGECTYAASYAFGDRVEISVNKSFRGIKKPDLGLDVDGYLCALELKHITTLSREAKYRFLGPKSSNVVKDFLTLYNRPHNEILCKLLVLYGLAQLTHKPGYNCETNRQSLNGICLQCAMDLLEREIVQKTGVPNISWQYHELKTNQMYVIEVDV